MNKLFWKLIRVFCRERSKLKIDAACSEDENLFQVFRNDYRWRQTRNKFIKKQDECQMCRTKNDLQVHHIKPWHLSVEGRYCFDNLITLCQPCHFRFGHWRNWREYNAKINDMSEQVEKYRVLYNIRKEQEDE